MGDVYRARAPDGREVALKYAEMTQPHRVTALARESWALAQLHHPGVVHLFDYGSSEHGQWLSMELLAHTTLRGQIECISARSSTSTLRTRVAKATTSGGACRKQRAEERAGAARFVSKRALRIALELGARLSRILSYVHAKGIIHADLKPENIMLVRGEPVLIDFGLARDVTNQVWACKTLRYGTVHYMAPEQLRADPLETRTDLYALGCILYEVLSGHPPFSGAQGEVARHQLWTAPLPLAARTRNVPDRMATLIDTLLQKAPDARHFSASNLADELDALSRAAAVGNMRRARSARR